MRAVDTNVLVRLIARDDAAQVRRAETFVADGAWVSCLVLAETVWMLEFVYERKKTQLKTLVAMLLEHEKLVVQDTDAVQAALNDYTSATGVDFSDCPALAIASKNGHGPLGTFDKKLAKRPGAETL